MIRAQADGGLMRVLANTQKTGTGGAALIEEGLRRVDIGFAEEILESGKDLYPGGKYGHQEGEEIELPPDWGDFDDNFPRR